MKRGASKCKILGIDFGLYILLLFACVNFGQTKYHYQLKGALCSLDNEVVPL